MNTPTKTPRKLSAKRSWSLQDLEDIEERVTQTIDLVRDAMLAPDSIKSPPTFSSAQLLSFCGIDKSKFNYRLSKGNLPDGMHGEATRRRFTLPELQQWVRACRPNKQRPEGVPGCVISVVNFKGGVGKTSNAVTLAQGLSLRGHSVLVVDMDAQASMTNLMGVLSEPDAVGYDDRSVLPLLLGAEDNIDYAVQTSYWTGIDVVAADLGLYSAEFALPSRQKDNPNFEFWHVLRNGLHTAREKYDVIIIDTPPSLSYTTVNAILASDGLLMPLPPSQLDFLSSAQFWSLINDLLTQLITKRGGTKEFAFIDVLLSKVDTNDPSCSVVREWIQAAYSDAVIPIEIPKTTATSSASAEFGTIYDLDVTKVHARTYRRAFEAYERMAELIEEQIIGWWSREGAQK